MLSPAAAPGGALSLLGAGSMGGGAEAVAGDWSSVIDDELFFVFADAGAPEAALGSAAGGDSLLRPPHEVARNASVAASAELRKKAIKGSLWFWRPPRPMRA